MKLRTIILTGCTLLTLLACSEKKTADAEESIAINDEQNEPGDSTLYGLACEGCTDSIIVFLPNSGGDPDTFDIVDARKARQVFGRPKIGDNLAVVVNPDDRHVADLVIDIDELKGSWGYQAIPTLRKTLTITPDGKTRALPDSIREKILKPLEFGLRLKQEWSAAPIGYRAKMAIDPQLPVEYPELKFYTQWRIFNGQLVLTEDRSLRNKNDSVSEISRDTVQLVMLRRDTLVLQFKDRTQGYYRIQQ